MKTIRYQATRRSSARSAAWFSYLLAGALAFGFVPGRPAESVQANECAPEGAYDAIPSALPADLTLTGCQSALLAKGGGGGGGSSGGGGGGGSSGGGGGGGSSGGGGGGGNSGGGGSSGGGGGNSGGGGSGGGKSGGGSSGGGSPSAGGGNSGPNAGGGNGNGGKSDSNRGNDKPVGNAANGNGNSAAHSGKDAPVRKPVPSVAKSSGAGNSGSGSSNGEVTGDTTTSLPAQADTPAKGPQQDIKLTSAGNAAGVLGGRDVPGGATLIFPPGALTTNETVDVSFSVSRSVPDGVVPPSGATPLGLTFEVLTSKPLKLGQRVTLSVNLQGVDLNGFPIQNIDVGVLNPDGVQVLPTRLADDNRSIIEAGIEHFTKFTIFGVDKPGPVVQGPARDERLTGLGTALSWTSPETTKWFQVQVAAFNNDGPAIDLLVGDTAMVQAGKFDLSAGNVPLLPDMTYSWRVRTSSAELPAGEVDWSGWTVSSFRTPATTTATLDRVAPQAQETVTGLTPSLTWANTDASVFLYEVQVSKDPNFGPDAFLYSEIVNGNMTEAPNTYAVPAQYPLEPDSVYYWHVRPRIQGDGAPLPWTPTYIFRTP